MNNSFVFCVFLTIVGIETSCRISFPGLKSPGHGVDHPPPSSAEGLHGMSLR